MLTGKIWYNICKRCRSRVNDEEVVWICSLFVITFIIEFNGYRLTELAPNFPPPLQLSRHCRLGSGDYAPWVARLLRLRHQVARLNGRVR